MKKGDINWEEFAKQLLWNRIVYDKNGNSGWEIDTTGEIGHFSILAQHMNAYKELTWKELCLELGVWEDMLVSDGHNCKECPDREKCSAYFKDDTDHEQCYGWQQRYGFTKAHDKKLLTKEDIEQAYYKRWIESIDK